MEKFYYEYEFGLLMKKHFKQKYGLSGTKLGKYLVLRYMVVTRTKNISKVKWPNFFDFIASELNISSKNIFKYKDSDFYINSSINQSISNIVENMEFICEIFQKRLDEKAIAQINKLAMSFIKDGTNKKRNKPSEYQKYIYLNTALSSLNEYFSVTPVFTTLAEIYPLHQGIRTLEEICSVYILDMSFCTFNYKTIKEKDLEEYLYKNLHRLLGFTPIQRQYTVTKDSIVDIYARDELCPVLIE